MCAWILGSQAEWLLGHADTALATRHKVVTLAERISHPPSLIMALSYAAQLHIYRREPELILDRLAAAEAVAVPALTSWWRRSQATGSNSRRSTATTGRCT
jgi:hypothetical protein